ncbi:MAG TPA: phosphohydrolase, partial [Treponemataceae bacterium]|nr:phosphohydrolase [Treponemataceae bacterium]
RGEEIPLAARIVALADVFDALSSRRVYKEAWNDEDVLIEIQAQVGKQFDPEIVSAFFQVLPTIREIQAAWPDK